MKCPSPKFTKVYFINPNDVIYDKDGNVIRFKRKYGRFDRKVYFKDF